MITITTPVHKVNEKYLREALRSIENQTFQGKFEWLILLNGEAINRKAEVEALVGKVAKVVVSDKTNIGALKREGASLAKWGIIVELDYDDWLASDALEQIAAAFRNPEVQFVYSDFVVYDDSERDSYLYGSHSGWHHYKYGPYTAHRSFPADARYLRHIMFSPNHIRAFRRHIAEHYDPNLALGDDYVLMCRTYIEYGERGFKHIKRPLYVQRRHTDSTSVKNWKDVAVEVDKAYIKYSEAMFKRWAEDNKLLKLDLGGRFNCPPGYESVDLLDADIIADLEKPWPIPADSVGVLRAYHILEHLEDPIHFFNEAYRVLAPGGVILLEVPSSKGDGAFADPTHKKFFNKLSFEYYTNERFARFIRPQYTGRFQISRIVEYFWSDPNIPIISVNMLALKGDYAENWCGIKKC